MEPFEKLIPLTVLLGVAAFLVVLLRRTTRDNTVVAPRQEVAAVAVAPQAEAPSVPPPVEPPMPPRAKRKKTIPAAQVTTPIHGVLELLQEKDALAKAFLLREILGPPVSRRK